MKCSNVMFIGSNELGQRYDRMQCGTDGWLCASCAKEATALIQAAWAVATNKATASHWPHGLPQRLMEWALTH
jgi:hypothetical protein